MCVYHSTRNMQANYALLSRCILNTTLRIIDISFTIFTKFIVVFKIIISTYTLHIFEICIRP